MNITTRFEKLIPNSKCYWDGNSCQLSVHVIGNPKLTKDDVERIVAAELNKVGLLRAVEQVRILSY
jgi:hypothetical protein